MKQLTVLLIIGFTYCGSWSFAAPACSQVFAKTISETQIATAIAEIAQMKLELDLSTSQGPRTLVQEGFGNLFSVKLAELTKALESRYTAEEVRAKISKEIHKLQNKSKEDATKEKVVRAETRDLLPNYIFKKRIEIPRQVTHNHVFEYIPELNVVIYQENNRFEIIKRDIDTGEETVIAQGTRKVHLLPDRKTVLVVSFTGQIVSVDIASGKSTPLNNLPPGNRMYSIVDTSGETLYASGDGILVAYNLKTQTSQTFAGIKNTYVTAAFGDKVILTGEQTPVLFDIATGNSQNIGPTKKIPGQFAFISDDNKQVALHIKDSGFEIYNLDNPEKRVSIVKKEKLAEFEFIRRYTKMIGADLIMAQHSAPGNRYGTWEIYSLSNLNQSIFEFLGYEPQGGFHFNPEYIKWTPDRKKAATLVRKQDDRGEEQSDFIDLWELQ